MNSKDLPAKKVSRIIGDSTVVISLLFERFVSNNKKKTYCVPIACSTGLPRPPGLRRQMMHKVAVVFFLSRMEGCLTTPVPLSVMETDPGVHLMLFAVNNGLIVVREPD